MFFSKPQLRVIPKTFLKMVKNVVNCSLDILVKYAVMENLECILYAALNFEIYSMLLHIC